MIVEDGGEAGQKWFDVTHPKEMTGYRSGAFGLVLIVAGMLLAGRGLMLLGRRGKVLRLVREQMTRGEMSPDLLVSATGPSKPKQATVGLVPATLAVLGLMTSLCPFLGIFLSGVALMFTHGEASWARMVSIIGLVLGVLSSGFAMVMIAMN